jgi:cellulose synthase/poly-beta-1,6-N-acetylglucosamine synthase-like glycosyltransferase
VWELLFWASVLFVAYTYVGYPALLLALRRRPVPPLTPSASLPRLSLVIAAHNESVRLAAKLQNVRALDYPTERLQVVVALDGCTDGTEAVARGAAGEGVRVVVLPDHRGKAAALNLALQEATGEIIVFADVRQRIDPGALRALAARFADPEVGVVSGELVLRGTDGDAVGAYWRYEKAVRSLESRAHSVVGATGALYAVRRPLVPRLPEGTLLDDVYVPMSAVLAGARCVLESGARVFDRTPCCSALEYRRKVRTLAGNFQLLLLLPSLLHPGRNPVWLQFVSHKVARLFVPYALLLLLVSSFFLPGPFYQAALVLQIAFYGLAAVGSALESFPSHEGAPAAGARTEVS